MLGAVFLACATPATASNLQYFGGPVVHAANVILVEWGSDARAAYTDPTTGDPGFMKYLAGQDGSTSDIGGVLAQYMDTTGHNSQNRFSYGGTVRISPTVGAAPKGSVLDSQLQSNLARAIRAGTLPAPSGNGLSTIYVVLFPPNDNVCFDNGGGCAYDAGGFCAYHGSFQLTGSSTQVVYAAMVDDGPTTPNFGGCGVGVGSDVGNQTSVVSHEVSEAINDPLDTVTSWYDYTYNGEIADRCDGQPAAANGPWTVESLWSNKDNRCQSGESAFKAPTASFLASSTGTAGQPLAFNAASSSDPSADSDSALNQNNHQSFAISSGIVSYRWNWGDGTPASTGSATASHTFPAAGNYQVSLTVTDRLGFTSTRTREVSVVSSTPGTPVVSTGAATNIAKDQATLNGTINPENQPVSYQFRYGTTPGSYPLSTPVTSGPAGQSAVPVSATITGLSPSTTYYYQLLATAGGNSYPGSEQQLTTTSSSPPPQKPTVGTGPAGRINSSGGLLTGTINPGGAAPVGYSFAYGTSQGSLDHTTPQSTQPGGTTAQLVTATLTGLAAHTTYYFRLQVIYNAQTYLGSIRQFTTSSPLPGVRTGGASHVARDSAVLSGWVNPHGTKSIYQVQFGRSATYGYSTTWIIAGSQASTQLEQIVVFGLGPGTTYHYRFVAQNRYGTAVGADRSFTTAPRAGYAPRFRLRAPARLSRRQASTRPVRAHFSCSKECLARFVLLVERSGHIHTVTLPVAVSHGAARLSQAGSGVVLLHLRSRFRSHLSNSKDGHGLTLVLVGYARSRGSGPSPPVEARIRLF